MRKVLLAFLCFLFSNSYAQSVEQIKANKTYLSGEGWGSTLKQADDAALQDLITKISVNVRSSFSSSEEETTLNGKLDAISKYSSIIKTYSNATLTNTQRIVIENEPEAHVLRYVKVSEIARIFEGRKAKVLDMVDGAVRAEKKGKIDDALRYYYWSLCLLKSLQYSNEVKYICPDGQHRLLSTWIPEKMNEIFSEISITPTNQIGNEVVLRFSYKGKSINSLDYTYFDGMDWSNIYSAKDGQGVIDLRPGQKPETLRIKCEYEFVGESHIDREIESVMALTGGMSFRNAYFNVHFNTLSAPVLPTLASVHSLSSDTPKNKSVTNVNNSKGRYDKLLPILNDITKGIANKKFNSLEKHFTPKGWEQFQKLIHYGRANLIGTTEIQFNTLGDKIICRGMTMSFAFKNNNRKFVENVVFTINNQSKVDEVLFGLGKDAYNDIMMKGVWDMDARLILANFLEEYKTAYALKDLDFIKNVFDDNAVIITGRISQRPRNTIENSQYINSQIVKYNRQTKNEYIRNLEHCFAGNEFINIRFANNDVVKAGKGGETYGIQIKQDYYSSTYGDTGYLFLMVDVNNPDDPIIKVRTWQPEKDPKFGIYGLSNF